MNKLNKRKDCIRNSCVFDFFDWTGPEICFKKKRFFSREKTLAFLKLSMTSREKNLRFSVLKSPKA